MFPTMGSWWSMADGKVVIDTGLDNSGFEKDARNLEGSAKSRAAKLAAVYRKQGMSASDAFKKAWSEIERDTKTGATKSGQYIEKEIGGAASVASSKVSGIGSGLSSSLKGIAGAAAAAFSVKAIVDFGKAAVEIGSNIAEVQNVVDTSFGDMSYKVEAFAGTAIEQFGMSALSAKKTASTYMSMARGMGLNEEAASGMSISLAGLTGDVASFYNISQELADTKLKSVFTGETETLKDLGVVMTQANLKAYAMSQGITKSLDSMSQAELVGLRYNYVMNSLSLAQGDFAKTSGSWANQTRILSENWKEFMSVIGQGLIQVLTPLLQVLNQIISALTAVVKSLFPSMSESSGAIQSAASGADAIASGMESATEAAKEFKKTTAGFDELQILSSGSEDSKSAGSSQPALMPSVSPGGGLGGKEVKELSGLAASIEKILAPFKNISFDNLSKSFGKLKNALKPITKKLFEGLEWGLENVLAPLSGFVIEDVLPRFLDTLSVAVSGLDTALNGIGGIIGSVGEKFAPAFATWGEALNGLGEPLNETFTKVGETVGVLWNETMLPFSEYVLGEFVPSMFTTFTETFAPIFSDVLPVAFDEFSKDFEFAAGVIDDAVNDIFKPAMEQAQLVATDAMNSIKKNWEERGQGILEKFQQMKESFRELWDHLYNGIIKPVIDNVINKAKELWENHLKPLWDNLVAFFMSLQECVMTIWNNFLKPIVDWLITVLGPIVKNVINGIIDVVMTVVGVVSDVVSGVIKFFRGLLDFITGVFSGDWDKAWQGIKDAFSGIWDAIWGVVKGTVNLIIDGLNLLWRGIYGVVSGIVNGIGSIAEALGELLGQDWGFTMPAEPPLIPKLAQGAVLPANKPFLAMLGDQKNGTNIEAPLSTIEQAVENVLGRQGTDGPYTIVLQVGSQRLGSVVLQSLRDISRQNGGLALDLR